MTLSNDEKASLLLWALNKLKNDCHSDDTERDHIEADAVLITLLKEVGLWTEQLATAWEEVDKWYA